MNDILVLEERIRRSIEAGESNFREFKTAFEGVSGKKVPRQGNSIRKDIGETLVAFANADGGMLLIGVEDNGEITGVPHPVQEVESFLQARTNSVHPETPLSLVRALRLQLDDKTVLYFSVDKSTTFVHLTSDGRCLQRKDSDSVPVPSEQIRFERQEQISREYDRAYVDGAELSSLDLDAVRRAGATIAPGLSVEKLLQLLDLADFDGVGVRLRRAALLLFARDVTRWHPRCDVRVLRVSGHELQTGKAYNVKSDETVRGSVFLIMSRAWDLLRPHLVQTVFGSEGLFEERIMYPEDACREALTNAIAHRDYSIEGRGIEVLIFDDRIEVRSPGSLLSNVSLKDLKNLKGVHESRNAKLTRVLRELGYVREMGEGIRRMYQLMKANDLVDPELTADFESFVVTLQNRSVFSEEAQRWIDGFEKFALTREEKKVVLLGHNGHVFSPQNVIDSLGIVDIDYYRQLLEGLQLKGILASKVAFEKTHNLERQKQWSRRGGGKRNVARFIIRPPEECEIFLSDLIRGLQELGSRASLTPHEYQDLTNKLLTRSPYRARSFSMKRMLAALNFLDRNSRPTARLLAIWAATTPAPRRLHDARVPEPVAIAKAAPVTDRTRQITPSSARQDRSGSSETSKSEIPRPSLTDFPEERATIFVGNLPPDFEDSAFKEILARFGTVISVKLPIDIFTGKLRGFAFVKYSSTWESQAALNGIRGLSLGSRKLRAAPANARSQA